MAFGNDTGSWGEIVAAEHLIREGYTIRERNWRHLNLEIDIIAEKDGCIIVVEVKTRSTGFADPILAINPRKQSFLIRAATAYLKHNGLKHGLRFDYILIEGNPAKYDLEHLIDAISPPTKFYR